jgi:hypothetical protein
MRLSLLVFIGAAACAPTVSTFQPASVPKHGTFGVNVAMQSALPVGGLSDALDAGKNYVARIEADFQDNGRLDTTTEQEIAGALRVVGIATVSLPSLSPDLSISYAFAERWNGIIRFAGNEGRIGVRNQILGSGPGFAASWGAAAGYSSFKVPLGDLDPLRIDDFKRFNVEADFLVGTSSDLGHLWAGPTVMFTTYGTTATLALSETCAPNGEIKGSGLIAAGTLGGAIGWKHIWLGLELTAGVAATSNTLDGDVNCPDVGEGTFVEEFDTNGLILGAEVGLISRF